MARWQRHGRSAELLQFQRRPRTGGVAIGVQTRQELPCEVAPQRNSGRRIPGGASFAAGADALLRSGPSGHVRQKLPRSRRRRPRLLEHVKTRRNPAAIECQNPEPTQLRYSLTESVANIPVPRNAMNASCAADERYASHGKPALSGQGPVAVVRHKSPCSQADDAIEIVLIPSDSPQKETLHVQL
jgi:hypothetical protein